MSKDHLQHLMSAYFHQDWPLEYADWSAAVDDFVRRSPERAERVPDEIGQLLQSRTTEEQLEAALAQLGAFVDPASLGLTHGEWLAGVRTRVLDELGSQPAER